MFFCGIPIFLLFSRQVYLLWSIMEMGGVVCMYLCVHVRAMYFCPTVVGWPISIFWVTLGDFVGVFCFTGV